LADSVVAFTLPAEPPTGTLERIALGGNGFTAPQAEFLIRNVQSASDGTGSGSNSIQIGMDPNYCWMVAYMSATVTQASSADNDWRFQLVGARVPTQLITPLVNSLGRVTAQIGTTWLPPASVNTGAATLSLFVPSVGTDLLNVSAAIFVFDIRAREAVPYWNLVNARGGI